MGIEPTISHVSVTLCAPVPQLASTIKMFIYKQIKKKVKYIIKHIFITKPYLVPNNIYALAQY